MPSKTILSRAITVAKSSENEFLVGAVLFKGPTILRASANNKKHIAYRQKHFTHMPTRHAEMSAMHGVPRDILTECSLLVVRVSKKTNQLTCAKPCKACLSAMLAAGIRQIYYSDYSGEIKKLVKSEIYIEDYKRETQNML